MPQGLSAIQAASGGQGFAMSTLQKRNA